jgi:hypothetical protein
MERPVDGALHVRAIDCSRIGRYHEVGFSDLDERSFENLVRDELEAHGPPEEHPKVTVFCHSDLPWSEAVTGCRRGWSRHNGSPGSIGRPQ